MHNTKLSKIEITNNKKIKTTNNLLTPLASLLFNLPKNWSAIPQDQKSTGLSCTLLSLGLNSRSYFSVVVGATFHDVNFYYGSTGHIFLPSKSINEFFKFHYCNSTETPLEEPLLWLVFVVCFRRLKTRTGGVASQNGMPPTTVPRAPRNSGTSRTCSSSTRTPAKTASTSTSSRLMWVLQHC